MSLPTRLPASVSILYPGRDEPLLVRGRALRLDGEKLDLELPEGAPESRPGESVILDFVADGGGGRAIANVESQSGGLLVVRVTRLPKSDLREFPRMMGGIDLAYAVAPDNEELVASWLAGGGGIQLRTPDPYMSFSTTGLAFDDLERCKENDLLLMEFSVPNEGGRHRCSGRVVRVSRIPIDERDDAVDATHRIAVNFETIDEGARIALIHHTEHCQEAFAL